MTKNPDFRVLLAGLALTAGCADFQSSSDETSSGGSPPAESSAAPSQGTGGAEAGVLTAGL